MRIRIHHPLFAGFLGVIGLLVVLIVVLVGTGLRRELVQTYQGEIERQLSLAAAVITPMAATDPDSLASLLDRQVGYRVTLIAPTGEVLGDSNVEKADLPTLENHATESRPEVMGALDGRVAFAQRRSVTVGRRLLYGAMPMQLNGDMVILRIAAPLDDIDAAVRRGQRAVAVAGLLSLLLALVVSYVLSRRLAAPLVTLSRRASSLAAGDFAQRAPLGRVAELDELGTAFNQLADELQKRLSELGRERDEMRVLIDCMAEGVLALSEDARVVRANRTAHALLGLPDAPAGAPVETLVSHPELRRLLAESVARPVGTRDIRVGDHHLIVSSRPLDLGGAVATFLDVTEIRRLENVRRDFVANASHELKTPLTSLRGWAETLEEDDPPDEIRKQIMRSIRKNTVRLQNVVDDLLDLSRLESGSWEVHDEMVPLPEVIEEVWSDFAPRAAKQDVTFRMEGNAAVAADGNGVAHVLRNLFDNALRYTDAGGEIGVTVTRKDGWAEVAVTDTGTGIPAEDLPRIFERFYRVDPARSRDAGGTGLGLAIVRHLVSAMGGEVTAESTVGEGTTIRFTLSDFDAPREVMDEVRVRRLANAKQGGTAD